MLRTAVTRLLFPPTLTYLIFYVAFSSKVSAHGAARYGNFSYGSYLYALPIQHMLAAMLKDRVSFAIYVLLALLGSLLAGVASWHLVEKWFLPRARNNCARSATDRPIGEKEATIVAT